MVDSNMSLAADYMIFVLGDNKFVTDFKQYADA
jgi:hypothetical protein